jgi:competence ComEA-like helix-hairpin-helix protein
MSWKDYFYFTKTERNGITVLVILIVLITVYPYVHRYLFPDTTYQYNEFTEKVNRYNELLADYQNAKRAFDAQKEIARTSRYESAVQELTPFIFNPNELSHEDFTSMGLPDRIARNIVNYRNAGGSFRSKEDFSRIYGVDDQLYNQLESFIDLPSRSEIAARSSAPAVRDAGNLSAGASGEKSFLSKEPLRININKADTTEWQKVRGIGPVFSRRITTYRERLGGFYSLEQLREVFGMDSTRFDQISEFIYLDSIELQKININSADFVTLVKHPYLERTHVNSILQMREIHGNYQAVEDLKRSHLIDAELFQKIEPYLKLSDEP